MAGLFFPALDTSLTDEALLDARAAYKLCAWGLLGLAWWFSGVFVWRNRSHLV